MNKNHELLNHIYQDAQMGNDAIKQLLSIAKDDKFIEHLRLQEKEYSGIMGDAKALLQQSGLEAKELGLLKEIPARVSINMKTMVDQSVGKMAEMMIEGSTMGIIETTKQIHQYSDDDPDALSLAKKLLRTEESNVEHLKAFL